MGSRTVWRFKMKEGVKGPLPEERQLEAKRMVGQDMPMMTPERHVM